MLQNAPDDDLEIEISSQDNEIVKIGFINSSNISEPYLTVAQAVDNAWFLVRQLDLPIDTEVTLAEIFEQRQYLKDIRLFLDVSGPSVQAITVSFTGHLEEPDKEQVIVFTRELRIGNYRILVVIGLAGPTRIFNDGTQLEISRPKRVHVDYFFLSEEDRLQDAVKSTYERLSKKGYEVIEDEIFPLDKINK